MKLLMEGKALSYYIHDIKASFLVPFIVYIYYASFALKSPDCHLPHVWFLERAMAIEFY
jgi:hypothetical protein